MLLGPTLELAISFVTTLICGANLELVRGLATATADERTPILAPAQGRCCVEIRGSDL